MSNSRLQTTCWLVSAAASALIGLPCNAQTYRHSAESSAGEALQHLAGHTKTAEEQPIDQGITIQLQGLYETNVRKSRLNLGGRHVVPEDELLEPALLANLQRPIGRESVFLNGDVGYDFYDHNSFLDRQHLNVESGINVPIQQCKNTVSGAYSSHQTDLSEEVLLVKNTEDLETIALKGDCTRTVGIAPQVTLSQGWSQNSAITRKAVDKIMSTAEGGLVYARPALGQIFFFGHYEEVDYPHSIGSITGHISRAGYTSYSGGARFTRELGTRLHGSASLSYEVLHSKLTNSTGFQGLIYSLDLTYTASTRLEGHLIAARETAPSERAGAAFSTNDSVSGDVTYRLGARLKLDLDGSYRRRVYGEPILTDLAVFNLSRETFVDGEGALVYDLSPKISVRMNVREEVRHADVMLFNYSNLTVGLRVNAKL